MKVRPFSGHRHRRGKASPQGVPGRSTGPGKDTAGRSGCGSQAAPEALLAYAASLPVGRSVFGPGRPETGGYPLTVGVMQQRIQYARCRQIAINNASVTSCALISAFIEPADDAAREQIDEPAAT